MNNVQNIVADIGNTTTINLESSFHLLMSNVPKATDAIAIATIKNKAQVPKNFNNVLICLNL